uniref:Uncharacterized protein n=1 Tax=Rousettus aegyptiacus TaxID=9407 RepID=A0A7J8IMG6_ROUAE|nr:hypothetical protein HJG63_010568 [Rousettus aegyptiacus]
MYPSGPREEKKGEPVAAFWCMKAPRRVKSMLSLRCCRRRTSLMGGNYTGADLPQQGRNSLKTHVMHHWSRMSCGPQGEGVQGCLAPGAPTEQALRKWVSPSWRQGAPCVHSGLGDGCLVSVLAV